MKVLVIASDELKEELMACPISPGLELQWITKPADFQSNDTPAACIDLLFENNKERIDWLKQLPVSLIIINAVVTTLKEIKENFIRINGWPTFLKRPVIEATGENDLLKQKSEELFFQLGRKTEWVNDTTGFITPVIFAAIINEAFITLEEKVSV